ncbi:MAG: FAD:protein FMN transferase [Halioglobus sp.]
MTAHAAVSNLFNLGRQLPSPQEVKSLLGLLGLGQATWNSSECHLPPGMQIDFGGIGKEYAVDRVLVPLSEQLDAPMLVNFGGDIATNRSRENRSWLIGVANPLDEGAQALLEIRSGGLATSGSSHRYIVNNGRRYSHVLNPLTGWPAGDLRYVAGRECRGLSGRAGGCFLGD